MEFSCIELSFQRVFYNVESNSFMIRDFKIIKRHRLTTSTEFSELKFTYEGIRNNSGLTFRNLPSVGLYNADHSGRAV
jgi:hypothetical protein